MRIGYGEEPWEELPSGTLDYAMSIGRDLFMETIITICNELKWE